MIAWRKLNRMKNSTYMRSLRIAYRVLRASTRGYPRWNDFIENTPDDWPPEPSIEGSGKNILMATSVGSHLAVNAVDSCIAAALTLRGNNVHALLCDRDLPACLACEAGWYSNDGEFAQRGPRKSVCIGCFKPSARMFDTLGIPVRSYGQMLNEKDRKDATSIAESLPFDCISSFKDDGIALGEHAMAGALRYFAKGSLEDEPHAEAILRRYFEAAILTLRATKKILSDLSIDVVVAHHGIYVPQGIIAETARSMGVRVVTWNPAYRKKCFIFSHDTTYHHTMMDEPVSLWEGVHLTPELLEKTRSYLAGRAIGKDDWIWFHDRPEFSGGQALRELGVKSELPVIGLLTNVIWDAQLHYRPNAFPTMTRWLLDSIEYFANRPEMQLVIRVHPAERTGAIKSRETVEEIITRAFPKLPDNVFVIGSANPVSTYAIIPHFNAALIYGTKTGIEITCMGKPVIVAGEAWIRGKQLTKDASSPEEYFEFLNELPYSGELDEDTIHRGFKYAFHFFFRRMIPLDFMEPLSGWPPYRVNLSSMDDLRPGRYKGLDVICEGIESGAQFIYPAEAE